MMKGSLCRQLEHKKLILPTFRFECSNPPQGDSRSATLMFFTIQTMVVLGGRDPISIILQVGYHYLKSGRKRVMHGNIGMHWTKMNTHV